MSAGANIIKLTEEEREAWQAHLGLVFPHKLMLRPDELTEPLGVDLRTVARLFERDATKPDKPWLQGIEFNASAGERTHRRIHRDAALLFYVNSANYHPSDFLKLVFDALEGRSPRELLIIQQRISELLRRAH